MALTKRDAEDRLAEQIAQANLPEPERQYRYIPGRQFAADFAWPARRVLLEVQGGIHQTRDGRKRAHGSETGIKRDIDRLNLAMLAGWKLYRITPEQVEHRLADGLAIPWIELMLGLSEVDFRDLPPFWPDDVEEATWRRR